MYVDFLTLIIPLLLIVTVVLQVIATKRVHRDISFEPAQRRAQLWLIWLVPVFGAALVLAVMHEEPDTRRGPVGLPTAPSVSPTTPAIRGAAASYRDPAPEERVTANSLSGEPRRSRPGA